MRVTTKFKKVLEKHTCEVRMDDAGNFELYLFNKKEKTTCICEGKSWGNVVDKAFRLTNKTNTYVSRN